MGYCSEYVNVQNMLMLKVFNPSFITLILGG